MTGGQEVWSLGTDLGCNAWDELRTFQAGIGCDEVNEHFKDLVAAFLRIEYLRSTMVNVVWYMKIGISRRLEDSANPLDNLLGSSLMSHILYFGGVP